MSPVLRRVIVASVSHTIGKEGNSLLVIFQIILKRPTIEVLKLLLS